MEVQIPPSEGAIFWVDGRGRMGRYNIMYRQNMALAVQKWLN